MEAQPAFVAHPALVYIDIAPRDHSKDRAIPMIDSDVTAGRAPTAYRIGAEQKPDPAFESEIARGKGTYRADVDDVAGIRIGQRLILDRAYFNMITPPKELHLAGSSHVLKEANTS
jgi:hypothetical protein